MITRMIRNLFRASLIAVLPVPTPARVATASTLTTLFSFTGGSDGGDPEAGLIFDRTGALYGTTAAGGSVYEGTVFKLTPPSTRGGPWTESVLHSFSGFVRGGGDNDGGDPGAGLGGGSTGCRHRPQFSRGRHRCGAVR